MDRPFSQQLLLDIRDTVQEYLNSLIVRGALLGGKVWLDPELNTEANLKAGKLFVDFDIEPPAPLEHLSFRAHREGSYYEELISQLSTAA
jgi:phage tail sheath protein FI